ncbi:hypothetical protein ACFRI7_06465 [Streptomyces sp. NPDC056716]|uniref:hypothetical protein n=1 Tax=unclassified Streptomyces TaxID=2593676 RepID=UPI00368CC635
MWSSRARGSSAGRVKARGIDTERRRRWPRPRWAAAVVLCLAAAATSAFVLLGDGDDPAAPRALTSDEVNRLAITRFLNYQAGGRAVTITVPNVTGGLVITGSIDYRTHTGYGVVRGTGRDTSSDGLIQWTATTVLVHPLADPPAAAPAAPPASGWVSRPLQTSGMTLDSALAIALDLGSDRPDNAALLPQNGAAWVGREEVRGRPTDIMNGPRAEAEASADADGDTGGADTAQTVRYWIGSDGTMYRVEAAIASAPQPVVFDFDTQEYVPVQPLPGATPTP